MSSIGQRLHAIEAAIRRRDLGAPRRHRLIWPAVADAEPGAPPWQEWDGSRYVACTPPPPDAIVLRWPHAMEEAEA
jgi:hypothetical protein